MATRRRTDARNEVAGLLSVADPSSPTGVEPPEVCVVVADEQSDVAVDADRWAALAVAALREAGANGELTLTFVDVDDMRVLNEQHMGGSGPTDVLSFPLDDDPDDIVVGPRLLGDVVVCPGVASEQAATHAGTLDDELALLTVHGVLHILGHDHADPADGARMRERELELLTAHHWFGPPPAGFRQLHDDAEVTR